MSITSFIRRLIFPPYCPFCKKTLPVEVQTHRLDLDFDSVCSECAEKLPDEPIITMLPCSCTCVSAVEYRDEYKTAILDLKGNGKRIQAVQLGRILAEKAEKVFGNKNIDIIASVPASKQKLKERGYNHAELLAIHVGKDMGIPYCNVLNKTRENDVQHKLGIAERRKNVNNVYAVCNSKAVCGKSILLIDDIVTTGYTMSDCVRALFESGASAVYCASVGKTPNKQE